MPAFLLLKINSQIGSPRAMKLEIKIDENTRLVFIEKLIFDFNVDVSLNVCSSILFDNSLIDGIIVTAREPMRVVGIIKRGNVIPIRIPNSDKASDAVYPYVWSLKGIMIAIIEETIEETVLTAVIGELDFTKFLNS